MHGTYVSVGSGSDQHHAYSAQDVGEYLSGDGM
jgi:hypothetical protein